MKGTELKCAGEAHPPPSYLWTNAVDNTTVEGDTFTLDAEKQYKLTCTVTTEMTHADGTMENCSSLDYIQFQVTGRHLQ